MTAAIQAHRIGYMRPLGVPDQEGYTSPKLVGARCGQCDFTEAECARAAICCASCDHTFSEPNGRRR